MIWRDTTTEHFASFAASHESLDEIRQFVQSALLATPLGKKAVAGLLLAVEEAVTNTIRHGYLFGPGRIRLRLRTTRKAVTITLSDNGRAYEVDWDEHPDAQKLAETGRRGGLGLLLIRKVTDAVDFRRVGDENILVLTKSIGPATSSVGSARFSARIAWAGALVVLGLTLVGATGSYLKSKSETNAAFVARWQEFARAAAASATQHLLNERSDAEFDQLVVGLKSAQPELRYVIIVDDQGRVRADSENPTRVHQPYPPPTGTAIGTSGVWEIGVGDDRLLHIAENMSMDRRMVGTVVLGVPMSVLGTELADVRSRVILVALVVFVVGGVVVGFLSVLMGRPLRKLGDMLQIAKSQGASPMSSQAAPDEISEVVGAINEVTEAVARSERQIARRDLARREMEQAEQLQRALLPQQLPAIDGYEAQAAYRMAQHVGGDYYDVIPLDGNEGLWAIIVADVAGKGFPAALVMTAVRTAMRLLAPTRRSPVDILLALDDYLIRHHPDGPFVTVDCCVLDSRHHTLMLASAGHTPALHHSMRSGQSTRLNPKGRPVGVRFGNGTARTIELASVTVSLDPGDSIVLYTDGLTEARSRSGVALGIEGLESVVQTGIPSAQEGIDLVLGRLNEYTEGVAIEDDVTLLVLRRCSEVASPAPGKSVNKPKKDLVAATA
jgi:serine phosphatase RsbU (regulator of sigma subunit)/anti-sigma regulatory factor (Ser/Thr protein kinase)